MLEMYKGRTLEVGQVVKVYYNLHKHCYSIMDAKTGVVLAHADTVTLDDVTFKVSETGRQRVIRERCKNVHAFVVGSFVSAGDQVEQGMNRAYYNPYKTATFQDAETRRPITQATKAHLQDKQALYVA